MVHNLQSEFASQVDGVEFLHDDVWVFSLVASLASFEISQIWWIHLAAGSGVRPMEAKLCVRSLELKSLCKWLSVMSTFLFPQAFLFRSRALKPDLGPRWFDYFKNSVTATSVCAASLLTLTRSSSWILRCGGGQRGRLRTILRHAASWVCLCSIHFSSRVQATAWASFWSPRPEMAEGREYLRWVKCVDTYRQIL